ncbi:hypothetical protein SCATT_09010 [Streptantibioticus cattleyicolor NRRL 8057 = DSM 46488]|uniref:Serine-threonine protein kinase n=1 Tax=Streptantibioticus cattleyicolor (strain ATCC 35852 / DSM 46488 / JCM 4925 / NBRC 14057 / NRRL 8057) TaxID=1003195 RepID=G8X1U8_STREN|nr:hypothetical protein SCATT_09010 [Streptantibioticus cattleyicolor NRRL 8057 = DSM 46488]MYS57993.1 hypothetical protein [Streptomyces sp. SID5468]
MDPYWELSFGTDARPDPGQRDRLLRGVATTGVTDLIVFAHGWNNDHSSATRLHRRFFTPFPALLERAPAHARAAGRPAPRVGYTGVFWPALRFADEPIPDHTPTRLSEQTARLAIQRGLDKVTLDALLAFFPEAVRDLHRMAILLRERAESTERLAEFCTLARRLADAGDHVAAADRRASGARPVLLDGAPVTVCTRLADALESTGAETVPSAAPEPDEEADSEPGDGPPPFVRLWSGARELLRQATYHRTKGYARAVGESGLAPVLARLATAAPGTRIHLVGHSYGARLVCFAQRALPAAAPATGSLVLLQGALSVSAFGPDGVLRGLHRRVDGPLVACHSTYDDALGTLYPAASRLPGEPEPPGAVGHEGLREGPAGVRLTLAETAPRSGRPFPARGHVSVDAGAVVRRGHPPIGAHMDICHAELARVVLRAGHILP